MIANVGLAARWGLIKRSSNYQLYADLSERVMLLLARHAMGQEVYSIDECFLDFTHHRVDLAATGRQIRDRVKQWTGLPVSVGYGATKTLAKLANRSMSFQVTIQDGEVTFSNDSNLVTITPEQRLIQS